MKLSNWLKLFWVLLLCSREFLVCQAEDLNLEHTCSFPNGNTALHLEGSRFYYRKFIVPVSVRIFDLFDPYHPIPLGEFPDTNDIVRISSQGDQVYLVTATAGFQIINVQD